LARVIEQVRIRNFGVIDEAVLDLCPGFNVVTGETGAGKTMVIRGLNLVFGGKADGAVVTHGATQASVEIDVTVDEQLAATVDELGGQVEDGILIVGRQVNSTGRSRSFLGGASVPAGAVAEVGSALVAVHGQSDQLRLTKSAQQRAILDRFGGEPVASAFAAYSQVWQQVTALESRIAALTSDSASRQREAEKIESVVAKFDSLKPQPGEDRELDEEAARLSNSEALYAAGATALAALDGDEDGAIGVTVALASGRKALEREAAHDPILAAIAQRIREVELLAVDVAAEVSSYVAGIDASPARQEYVESRRAALKSVAREFGDVDALIEWVSLNRVRLDDLRGGDDLIEALSAELAIARKQLADCGAALTAARTVAAESFAHAVSAELDGLAMPGASVEFVLEPATPAAHGADNISFGLRSRPGAPWVPLAKGASGGELSRIMLAVEVVLASVDPMGTFIFDEVDAGIGGAAGVEIGKRLARLARNAQVIVVTHLPQVAAFADRHLVVARSTEEQVHSSGISEVTGEERVSELARMLAGLSDSAAGESLARELMDLASQHS
jgi:DNA repair protein RecN (Recombination protein N)